MLELFNILDWVIVAIAAFFVIRGLVRGLLSELGSLVALFASIAGSVFLYQPVADFLRRVVGRPDFWWETLAFIICFIVIYLFIMFIAGRMGKVFYKGSIPLINRVLGAVLGLAKAVILCFVIINLLIMAQPYTRAIISHDYLKEDWIANSYLAPIVIKCGNLVLSFVPGDFVVQIPEAMRDYNPNLPYNPSIPAELNSR